MKEVIIMDNKVKKCSGCGVVLQEDNMLQEGYTTSLDNDVCQRCFRMKNYGEYQVVAKSNEEYIKILEEVAKTKDLVLYVTDLLNLEEDILKIREYIPNKMILVLNKKDVLPKSVKEEKIRKYFEENKTFFDEIIVVSVEKNYNIDRLLKTIKLLQTTRNVYVVGHTNAGKSTLINKLIKNYATSTEKELTMSPLPSTTLSTVSIEINEYLTLIDTPGLVDMSSMINYVDTKMLKKMNPKKEIKPKTYQLKKDQSLVIEDLARIDYKEGDKNSFTIFMSNDLKIKRFFNPNHEDLKEKNKTRYELKYDSDLVINGLGFIKIVNKGTIDVYVDQNIATFIRSSLI